MQQLRHEGVTSKSWKAQSGKDRVGKPIDKGALYKILNNPVYLGQIRHKGVAHPGEHEAIVTLAQWETVQAALASKPNGARKGQIRTERPALLKGLIYTTDGRAMTPHTPPRGVAGVCTAYLSTRDAKEGHCAVAGGTHLVSPNEMQVRLHPNGIERLALDVVRAAGRKAITGTSATEEPMA